MKKILSICIMLFCTFFTYAQVGIGTTSPHASSSLHIEDANKGLVIPRVSLTNVTNGTSPVLAPLTSLLVYNTNATVTGGQGTGFYFWNGTLWEKINSGTADHDWYEVGTTTSPDNINDNIFTNNNVGINVSNPGGYQLMVGDDTLPAVQLGAHTFNNAESGRLVFGEEVNTYNTPNSYCGLEFRYDGLLNSLFLTGACLSPINIATFERTGSVGIGTTDPSERLEIGGNNSNLFMNSTGSNIMRFNTEGVNTPTFTSRSLGTKLVLYPQMSASTVDYAFGIGNSTLWSSIPQAILTYSNRWYAGTTELMRLRGDNRLGIGTTTPTATRLEAYDPSTTTARIAVFRNNAFEGTEVQIGSIEYTHDYSSTTDFNNGANSVGLTINYAGTSAYDLQLAYNSAGKPTSGAWTIVSDARLKEDVHPFKDGLSVLKQINPIYFKYNGKGRTPKDEYGIGVLAQEVQDVAPYMVGKLEVLKDNNDLNSVEDYLSYNPDALHYITINAVKELDNKVNALQTNKTIQDFGVESVSSNQIYVAFNDEFKNQLAKAPVVTVTPIGQNAQLTIVSQDKNGFTVSVQGNISFPLQFNWIAMYKLNQSISNTEIKHTTSERQELINKVKLPEPRLRERIKREQEELAKFRATKAQQEAEELARDFVNVKENISQPTRTKDIDSE